MGRPESQNSICINLHQSAMKRQRVVTGSKQVRLMLKNSHAPAFGFATPPAPAAASAESKAFWAEAAST